jgi:aromatic-L-amino-acid decarboxylase
VTLHLGEVDRRRLWQRLVERIEAYDEGVDRLRVAPALDVGALRDLLAPWDFATPRDAVAAVDFAADALQAHQVHTAHPMYFGLFNPAPTTAGIAADALVAAFNPQMAAWSHNPFAAEAETHMVRALAARFGLPVATSDGTFCSGGAEANHTAVLAALCHHFPAFRADGVRALPGNPVLYVSAEAHHSFLKAARLCGLGTSAVREVPVEDDTLRLRVDALADLVRRDRAAGHLPFLVVATLGTTAAGAIDPIAEIAELAGREGLWLHADAAWGGAAALVPELRPLLAGVERADSITVDAHKWFSVPMAAGLFLTRHAWALSSTFRVAAGYMPREAQALGRDDPYAHSMQWSRRFIGLKLFLSLAVAGWDGYAAAIRSMTALGDRLRRGLRERGLEIRNHTPLPLVCAAEPGADAARVQATVDRVVGSGRAWVSFVLLAGRRPAVRACITSHRTEERHVDALVELLGPVEGAGS